MTDKDPTLSELIKLREILAKIQLLKDIDNSDTSFNHGTIELLAYFKRDLNRQKLTALQHPLNEEGDHA